MSLLVYYPKYRLSPGYRIYDIRYGSNLNSIATNSSNSTNTTNATGTNTTNITLIKVNGLSINSNIQLLPMPSVNQSIIATF
jgi:hypothetical protein